MAQEQLHEHFRRWGFVMLVVDKHSEVVLTDAMPALPLQNVPLPVVGEIRLRLSYPLRVVGFLGHDDEVAILEGVEDGRRTTVTVREVQTWKVLPSCQTYHVPSTNDPKGN